MNQVNGSIPTNHLNGVELACLANGYHEGGNGSVTKEVGSSCNGDAVHGLVRNGKTKISNCNGNIKLKFNFETSFSLPFDLLPGEHVEQNACGKEAWVLLTNFRLFICHNKTFYNIPVRSIEYVEMRELSGLHVHCKDGKVMRIGFDSPEDCSDWWRYITSSEASQSRLEELFAFSYFNVLKSNGMKTSAFFDGDCEASMYVNEIRRMGFNTKKIWRTTEINTKFEICKTYPKFHIVPACVSDDDLKRVAQFRSLGRFPSVVWRSQTNGAVLARSSQPEVGWFGWRCDVDEKMLPAIGRAATMDSSNANYTMTSSVMKHLPSNSNSLPFLVIDARSYAAAVANRAKGGGCECQEYYSNCDIKFMGLPNIHAIRKSFQSIRALCLLGLEQNNWYSALEATKWLQYLSGLIKSALIIVEAIDMDSQSTLVHCSDGWDRTPQLVSLAQLLLDPYYRTIKGFRILIEREWLEFGHKFADRCGHSSERDMNERCPVFFQWLDTVYQIMRQFPSAFEFNEFFLVKLASHVYSCLYGTFLCNSIHERHKMKLNTSTVSIWCLLMSGRKDFVNYLYVKTNKVLYPNHHIRCLQIWETMFLNKQIFSDPESNEICALTRSVELTDSGNSTMGTSDSRYRKASKENRPKEFLHKSNLSPRNSNSFPNHLVSRYQSLNVNNEDQNQNNSQNGGLSMKPKGSQSDGELQLDKTDLLITSSFIDSTRTVKVNSNSNLTNESKEPNILTNENKETIILSNEKIDNKSCTDFLLNPLTSTTTEKEDQIDKLDIPALVNNKLMLQSSAEGDKTIENPSLEYLQKSTDQMSDSLHTLTGDSNDTNIENELIDNKPADLAFVRDKPKPSESISIPSIKENENTIRVMDYNEHRRSFDDLCLALKSTPPTDIEHSLGSRNNSMRRAHSSPDSPTLNRLQRTKSVPDVMAVSCINSNDLPKQYSSVLETNQSEANKNQHIPTNLDKFIDVDGLTIVHSFIDHKLYELRNRHINEMTKLYRKYELEKQKRMMLQQQVHQYSQSLESCSPASFSDFLHDADTISLPDSNCDRTSMSSISNDEGWEQVQYDDVQPTRWIPDHLSSTCLHCGTQFSVIHRRHHCRKCGGIFCDACSNYQISVPEEQLYNPVRVCIKCFDASVQNKPKMEGVIQFDHI